MFAFAETTHFPSEHGAFNQKQKYLRLMFHCKNEWLHSDERNKIDVQLNLGYDERAANHAKHEARQRAEEPRELARGEREDVVQSDGGHQ